MRSIHHLFAVLGLLALVAGCGGSGTSSPTDAQGAGVELAGKIVSVDGSTQALGGVQVLDLDADVAARSDAAGSFQLRARAGERLRLRFDAGTAPTAAHGPDVDERKDGKDDDSDLDGDVVEFGPFGDGETCEIEVELADGRVVECWIEHDGDRERVGSGESPMDPPAFPGGLPCRGEVEIRCDGECCSIEVEVGGFEEPGVLEVVLVNAEGDEASLGDFVIDDDGIGHFEWEICKGDELPFGVEDARELAGVEIVLIDDEGNVQLVGRIPGKGPDHDDDDRCHGVSFLEAPDGSDGKAKGLLLAKVDGECSRLWLEVSRIVDADELELFVHEPDGDSVVSLGTFAIGDHGMGHLVFEVCSADDLPFDAETVADLAGAGVTVEDASGTVRLEGKVPETAEGDCDRHPGPPPGPGGDLRIDLLPPEGSPEPDASGELFHDCDMTGCDLVIEVEGFSSAQTLKVLFVMGEKKEALGTFDVGSDGTGAFVLALLGDGKGPVAKGSMPDMPAMPDMPPPPEPMDVLFRLVDADGAAVLEGTPKPPAR